jgi:hypothetical protein
MPNSPTPLRATTTIIDGVNSLVCPSSLDPALINDKSVQPGALGQTRLAWRLDGRQARFDVGYSSLKDDEATALILLTSDRGSGQTRTIRFDLNGNLILAARFETVLKMTGLGLWDLSISFIGSMSPI